MLTSILRAAFTVTLAFTALVTFAASGCAPQVSTLDRGCPCEPGFTCCAAANVCLAEGAACGATVSAVDAGPSDCPAGVVLASGNATDRDATGPLSVVMTGQLVGAVPMEGAAVAFDYDTSATASADRVTLQGWVIDAGGTLSYAFHVWAQDGANQLPLQLVAYGPMELGPTEGTCFATLVGGGPMPTAEGTFLPTVWGRYFVTAYHPLAVEPGGQPAIADAGDGRYRAAFLSMEPSD